MQSLQLVVVVGISLLLSSLGRAAPIEYLRDDRSLYIQGYLGAPVNEYYYRDDRPRLRSNRGPEAAPIGRSSRATCIRIG
jgi:hypothetical protein